MLTSPRLAWLALTVILCTAATVERVLIPGTRLVERLVNIVVAPAHALVAATRDVPRADVPSVEALDVDRALPNDDAAEPPCIVNVVHGNASTEALPHPELHNGAADRAEAAELPVPRSATPIVARKDVAVKLVEEHALVGCHPCVDDIRRCRRA